MAGLLFQARQDGCHFLVCSLSEHYQEIFRIKRLAEHMTVVADEEGALIAIVG